MSQRHLEGACEKLGKNAATSISGPGSPTGHLWALQHGEKEDNTSSLPRNHKRKHTRHEHPSGTGEWWGPTALGVKPKKSEMCLPQAKAAEQAVPPSLPAPRVTGCMC